MSLSQILAIVGAVCAVVGTLTTLWVFIITRVTSGAARVAILETKMGNVETALVNEVAARVALAHDIQDIGKGQAKIIATLENLTFINNHLQERLLDLPHRAIPEE